MITDPDFDDLVGRLRDALRPTDLDRLDTVLSQVRREDLARILERFDATDRAVLFRLLPRDLALGVFERFDQALRNELFSSLRDDHVVSLFEMMDPDDRAVLIDELPATLAKRLLQGLSPRERALTAPMLGYRSTAIGRRMSPEYVRLRPAMTAAQALDHVRSVGAVAETVYLLPVADDGRLLVGVVSMRELVLAAPNTVVRELMSEPLSVPADTDSERAARRCVQMNLLAMPVVDSEQRLIGILTVDDAARILAEAEAEDAARAGAAEPLRRPYLSTPVLTIVRSRIVWLLVLAVSALLTVQVLEVFEHALASAVLLALFIPLLTGTAGNTGSQAATTITRALATGDVRPRDAVAIMMREARVGITMGAGLGVLGFALAAAVYGPPIGLVIGATLPAVCLVAATVGGTMPLIARAIRVDPAVFSTPFISTFCDATSLIIYFLIAVSVLGI